MWVEAGRGSQRLSGASHDGTGSNLAAGVNLSWPRTGWRPALSVQLGRTSTEVLSSSGEVLSSALFEELQLAGFANDTRLTVAFDLFGADHVQDTLDENCAEAFADVDQLGQVVNVAAGKGVCNHGDGRDFLDWCIEGPASFNQGFLLDRYLTSNFH